MARNSDQLFEAENTGGLLSGLLAEEDDFDRFTLWRLGSWGAISVAAVVVALYASQSSMGLRHEQLAAAEFARQTLQIQLLAKESQGEARRLASAIDTLNGDRDRLYSRVTVLEQGLDSVTGSIAKQSSAPAPASAAPPVPSSSPSSAPLAAAPAETPAPAMAQKPPPAAAMSPVTTTATSKAAPAAEKTPSATEKPPAVAAVAEPAPATVASVPQPTPDTPPPTPAVPLMSPKSIMAPPDPAAGKLIEPSLPPKTFTAAPIPDVVASAPPIVDSEPDASETPQPKLAVQQTEFAVDVGSANSVAGLRALWRGLKSNRALADLRPVIAVKEGRGGFGMQLRLVAGPLQDAAAAAKICAGLIASKRACETTVFDGQRLSMNDDDPPVPAKPAYRKRSFARHAAVEEPKKPEPSTLSRIFGSR
jgi:hypothetical protein